MSDLCTHDWQPFWDGSLGYTATDCCRVCGDYRPTPQEPPVPPDAYDLELREELTLDADERGGR